ncbi:FapA family protein [Paludicola sp. MB14-C6]|uniref:DUF342 domain-containing protein n=1 Tax=Paludihabitans sp. MB14-C6 TaxID=3070656 RepID=UPI0027DD1D0D|nr:FapA family protein [Paludicola sp. MB14-C6]WMJ24228.1 FapA family protein [Paludicola sp. MB14-C6]
MADYNESNPNNTTENSELSPKSEAERLQEQLQQLAPPEINLRVSSDNLVAYIRVKLVDQRQTVAVEDIQNVLNEQGITYGIDTEAIQNFCEKRLFYSELTAARGIAPIDGKNGTITYSFKTDESIRLKENENGIVDYKELGTVQNVNKGDVLCTATPAIDGVDGMNIFGEPIPFRQGIPGEVHPGTHTVLSEDRMSVLAEIDGSVELRGKLVCVNDVYIIKGDVNSAVGNIDSVGSVIVQGDVREGFTVKSKKDITVKGIVEGATLIAEGNINIMSGMNGMGIGKLQAKGNIISKYIENTSVECDGDVYADVLLNSNTNAKGSVILKGSKASIIGGVCQAGVMIYASYIGASTNVQTIIILDSDEIRECMTPDFIRLRKNLEQVQSKINGKQYVQQQLQDNIRLLSRSMGDPQAKQDLKQAMMEKNKVAGEIIELQKELEKAQEEMNRPYAFKVIALKKVYIGTKINIGYLYMNISEEYSNTKFYADGHDLTAGQILPSEKL